MNARAAAELEIRFLSNGSNKVIADVNSLNQVTQTLQRNVSARQNFRMDQLAENSIVGALGANNQLTAVLGQLERLQFQANQTGQSLGKMLMQAAPTAIAIAAAAMGFDLVISKAQALSAEIDKLNTDGGRKAEGFFGNVVTGWKEMFGLNPDLVTGPASADEVAANKTRARDLQAAEALRGLKPQSLDEQFTAWFKAQDQRPSADLIKAKYAELAAQIEAEAKATTEAKTAKERSWKTWDQIARKLRDEELKGITGSATQKNAQAMANALAAGKYKEFEALSKQLESDQADDAIRQQLVNELKSARNQQRALQMRGVEQGAAPWRDLGNLNWFADVGNAGSQAEMLDQFRATNKLSLPDSVEQQMKELQQREVDEMAKLTSAITSLEQRITNAGGSTADTWSTSGAL